MNKRSLLPQDCAALGHTDGWRPGALLVKAPEQEDAPKPTGSITEQLLVLEKVTEGLSAATIKLEATLQHVLLPQAPDPPTPATDGDKPASSLATSMRDLNQTLYGIVKRLDGIEARIDV